MNAGAIVFSTELDNKSLEGGLEKLQVKFRKATDDVKRQTAAVQELESKYKEWQAIASAQQKGLGYVTEPAQAGMSEAAAKLDTAKIKLDQLNVTAQETGASLREAMSPQVPAAFAGAAKAAQKRISTLKSMLDRYIMRALFLVAVYQGIQKVKEYFGEAMKTNADYVKAVGQLKAAFMTLAQPILQVLLPAVTKLAQVLAYIVTQIAAFVSTLSGSSLKASQDSAKSLYDQQEALDGVGKSAKKAGNSLASFDEINKLSANTSSASGTSDTKIAPDFDSFKPKDITDKIDEVTVYVSGALLALGALLTFSGANIPLGLGLMALGAIGLTNEIKENWGAADGKVKNAVTDVMFTLGTAALVIGACLTFSGANLPLGIGLMVIGAASLGTAAALNWDKVKSVLQGPVGAITAIISASLLAVGAILAISGVNLPLGIALIAAGAIGLAGVATLNWESVSGFVKTNLDKILLIGGASLLALGLILALSGVALPLGIALMAAGGASLITAGAMNWNAILDKLKEAWANVKNWWLTSVAPVLSALGRWFAEKVINPLLSGVESFINFFIYAINALIRKINSIRFNLPDIFGGGTIGFSVPELSTVSIPRLATGAVIPPNSEFLAVLGDQKSGTNIEAPLETIVQAFRRAMAESGGGRSITVIMEMNKREFARAVYNANNDETQRVGVSLV